MGEPWADLQHSPPEVFLQKLYSELRDVRGKSSIPDYRKEVKIEDMSLFRLNVMVLQHRDDHGQQRKHKSRKV